MTELTELELILRSIAENERDFRNFTERSKDKSLGVVQRERWKQIARETKERAKLLQRLLRAEEKRQARQVKP